MEKIKTVEYVLIFSSYRNPKTKQISYRDYAGRWKRTLGEEYYRAGVCGKCSHWTKNCFKYPCGYWQRRNC